MNASICLIVYAAALAWLAPAALRRITGRGRSPRLAVTVWLATIAVAATAWLAGFAGILNHLAGPHPAETMRYCADIVLAVHQFGWAGDVALGAAGITTLAASFVAAKRAATTLRRLWRRSHEHAHAAHVLGAPTTSPGVFVMNTGHPAAYCVAGRPHAIVVTSAAVHTLTERELDAVLAHERAHLSGRHPHLMMLLRALTSGVPRLPLLSSAVESVGRLVEMSADDAAARRHGRDTLLRGLVALADPAPIGGPALAAADTAVLARAERLATPTRAFALLRERIALAAVLTVLVTAPAVLTLVCHY